MDDESRLAEAASEQRADGLLDDEGVKDSGQVDGEPGLFGVGGQ